MEFNMFSKKEILLWIVIFFAVGGRNQLIVKLLINDYQ